MSGPPGGSSPARPAEAGPRSELAFIAALVTLVAFVYLGASVSLAAPGTLDGGIRDSLMTGLNGDPAQAVLGVLNVLGSFEGGAILTIGLAGLLLGLRRPGAAVAIASVWLADGVSTVAKDLLMRPRPPDAIVDTALGENWSYPSGHVVRAMAIVGVLAWIAASRWTWNRRTLVALVAGLLAGLAMGVARVATGAHWPTDVVGGLLLGTVYLLLLAVAAEAALSRRSRGAVIPPPPSPGPGSA